MLSGTAAIWGYKYDLSKGSGGKQTSTQLYGQYNGDFCYEATIKSRKS